MHNTICKHQVYLVSNIGGVIGLMLGMSLLSVFETLEMIIISIYLIIKIKTNRQN